MSFTDSQGNEISHLKLIKQTATLHCTETLGKFCAELKLIENFKNILHTSSYPQNLLSFTIGESMPSMGNISFQF